jgi:hypothetical protein
LVFTAHSLVAFGRFPLERIEHGFYLVENKTPGIPFRYDAAGNIGRSTWEGRQRGLLPGDTMTVAG